MRLPPSFPGPSWVDPAKALLAYVDVLARCALGGILRDAVVPACAARWSLALRTTS